MPHPVEEGSGAPSLKPLWRLMPYLWPKVPELRVRVFVSLACLVLAIAATAVFPIVMGRITDQLAQCAARHAEGRLVSSLEGGYDLEALAGSAAAHVRQLMAA